MRSILFIAIVAIAPVFGLAGANAVEDDKPKPKPPKDSPPEPPKDYGSYTGYGDYAKYGDYEAYPTST